ncbi:MAG TPA: ammonia-forming cytochrome c nitrite reductase subunit c552 [Verrucomicrobiales bacterium]|nr:ammonia-forming cytochrome c nitrite reductase subunit c552 [Verrucomicrobiales bacterium]
MSKSKPSAAPPAASRSSALPLLLGIAGFIALVAWLLLPQADHIPLPVSPSAPEAKITPYVMPEEKAAFAQYAGDASCAGCHAAEHAKWKSSNHGLAERLPDPALDLAAFDPAQSFQHGSQTTEARKNGGVFEILSLGFDGRREPWKVERVIGHDPLRQFLVHGTGGRLHAMEACFDPHKGDWFNVYGDEDRKPGEWGHWTGRGMVWNQMCASCHNTRLRKNYDPATDSYHTAMAQLTVSCESCHGPMKAHDDWQRAHQEEKGDPHLVKWTRDQHIENCAGCHARRGEITGDFVPGESFWDHYLLTITDPSDIYHPDGQIRDENYEFASFLSSRMHHAGVRCMDCHDMHSMRTILPGNQLCMRCHTPGGFPNSPPILPEVHSFHKAGSTGNQCVNCHMSQTTYMQRDPRHDHGFVIPDPLLTKEHGVPNACNKCHQDQTVDWAIAAVDQWYGPKMERHTRKRAFAMAEARQGKASGRDGLLALLQSDEIPHWKASATLTLDRWISEPRVQEAVAAQLDHPHPLVRQSAARVIEPALADGRIRSRVEKLLEDTARSVRVTAAWALRETLDPASAAGQDLQHMLRLNSDQPSGQMQLGQYHYARRDLPKAIQHMRTAVEWDPNSPPFHHDLAMLYNAAGDTPKTIAKLRDAIRLAPRHAEYHYALGLALSETGDMPGTIAALRETVRLDPAFARAWYNLGLALNGENQPEEAIAALFQGEKTDPRDPGIPYARATIHARLGQKEAAIHAARQALSRDPAFHDAQHLLQMLQR